MTTEITPTHLSYPLAPFFKVARRKDILNDPAFYRTVCGCWEPISPSEGDYCHKCLEAIRAARRSE